MDRDLLIQYVDILNKMENIPYDVRMSRNDLDYSIIDFFEKKAGEDEELQELLKKIKSLPSSERAAFVKEYLAEKDAKVDESASQEEEIAKVFGVNIEDIQHLFLSNGTEVFYFYDSDLGRNVVLENGNKEVSLTEQLQKIQQEYEEYQTENDSDNAHEILTDEALKTNMELQFYSDDEIYKHETEIEGLKDEDRRKIRYLLNHYDELMIEGINIENMVYLDKMGNIYEITAVKNKIIIAAPDSQGGKEGPKGDSSEEVIENDSPSSELDDMINDDEDLEEKINDKDKQKRNKSKVYVKEEDNLGFTNNAFYFFIAGLVLVIIFVILFIIIS